MTIRTTEATIDSASETRPEAGVSSTQASLAQALQGSPVPTFVIDADHRVTHWNRACETIIGVPASEVVGTREQWRAFYSQERPVLADLIVDGALESDIARLYAGKYRKSGLVEGGYEAEDHFPHFGRWLFFTAAPLRDAEGAVIGAIETLQDITERKRAEETLRLYHRAVESSNNGILITDLSARDNTIVYVNAAFERLSGYAAGEVIGRNPRFLVGNDWDQRELEIVRAALRQRRPASAELRAYRKDGSMFWNELFLAPVRDDAGRVTHFISVLNDITSRKRYEEQLERQVNQDELTKLANRNLLADRLEQALAYAQRYSRLAAVVLIDLDNFKWINDTLSHTAGDQIMQEVGRRLLGCVRGVDTVARMGDDDFAVVLFGLEREDEVMEAVRRIRAAMAAPHACDGTELRITGTIGAALFPRDGADAAALLKSADIALYQAKEQGVNTFQIYQPEMNLGVAEMFLLERDLRHALDDGTLNLVYQPQLDLRTGRIIGAEALPRWNHPEKGLIPPERFIPIAEQIGLIGPIATWIFDAARAQGRRLAAAGWPSVRVAVNLAARPFKRQGLVRELLDALSDRDIGNLSLELEITEGMILHNPLEAIATLRGLKGLGLRLSVDDLGAGPAGPPVGSPVGPIGRRPPTAFPLDVLKIGPSFVREITLDPDSAAVTVAVISLAHSLKLRVIAEGVETAEQAQFLRDHGCDGVQGHYFSPPLSAEDLLRRLEGQPTPPS